MRSVPELRFFYDDAIDTGMRISELLNDNGIENYPGNKPED